MSEPSGEWRQTTDGTWQYHNLATVLAITPTRWQWKVVIPHSIVIRRKGEAPTRKDDGHEVAGD